MAEWAAEAAAPRGWRAALAWLRERWADLRHAARAGGHAPSAAERAEAERRFPAGLEALEAGRLREATRTLREVARLDVTFLPAHLRLGQAYVRQGAPERALRAWVEGYAATRARPLLEAAEQMVIEQAHPERMLDFYQQALRRTPRDLLLRYALGRLYLRLDMLEPAGAEFEALIAQSPGFLPAYLTLGQICERRGQAEEAARRFRAGLAAAVEASPEFRCAVCRAPASLWTDRCPACGRWNSLEDLRAQSLRGPA